MGESGFGRGGGRKLSYVFVKLEHYFLAYRKISEMFYRIFEISPLKEQRGDKTEIRLER